MIIYIYDFFKFFFIYIYDYKYIIISSTPSLSTILMVRTTKFDMATEPFLKFDMLYRTLMMQQEGLNL